MPHDEYSQQVPAGSGLVILRVHGSLCGRYHWIATKHVSTGKSKQPLSDACHRLELELYRLEWWPGTNPASLTVGGRSECQIAEVRRLRNRSARWLWLTWNTSESPDVIAFSP